jgi:hypothetical protein
MGGNPRRRSLAILCRKRLEHHHELHRVSRVLAEPPPVVRGIEDALWRRMLLFRIAYKFALQGSPAV